ncbi:MAG: VTT domain-containing protein [Bacilli bacterium]
MEQLIQPFIEFIKTLVENSNIFISVSLGVFIIILESIIPILPLAVFIAINMLVLGNTLGFVVSWIATIIGSSLSFIIFRKFKNFIYNKMNNNIKFKKFDKFMIKIGNIQFSKLVLILAIPFTPAFSINIAAGLSEMSYRKYLFALIISKIFLVYFWGFVGTTFVESITDINIIMELFILILIAYLISKFVVKKFNIK